MAPTQSRQLLIWSLPTLALLFGFFWYKRKKNFFQTDPGGTGNTLVKQTSDQSKGTINKSYKTSDCSYEDDDEYTVHDLKFTCIGDTIKDDTVIKKTEVSELSLDSAVFDQFPCTNTSTPFDKKKELLKIIEDLSSSGEIQDTIESISFSDSLEAHQLETSNTGDNIPQKLISTVDCAKQMVKKRKQKSSNSSVGIVAENSLTENTNCSIRQQNSLQSSDVQESDNKENKSLNSNSKEVEAIKNLKVLSKSEELASTVNNPCTDASFQEELGNILESKVAEKEVTDEKNENSSGTEKKLSNLGLNMASNVEKTERDSANHSPAEVMLGSPSICNFSDVHSEGSSDSGKGCSDVVTPPSRTPAGGSSVAGDQILSVYEFVLEQHIVGRLIGRHGSYLQDIRSKTNTNLFIKRHPETTKLKICAIEGTQQDIDAALAMIRQKFPLRRFPNLTLEKVTFVQPSNNYPLKPDIFQLQLVEGVNNDVLLSSLISAGHFFLQQPTHPSYPSLQRLNIMMNTLYSSPEAPILSEPIVDAICVAPTMGGWYRAQIMSIDEQNGTSDVRFLDYGGYLTVDNSLLRQIRGDFLLLPFQAIECMLANVLPAGGEGGEWSDEARQVVQCLTQQQVLQAQVYDYTEAGIPLVYLYSTQSTQNGLELVLINQDLVARGYAEIAIPASVAV